MKLVEVVLAVNIFRDITEERRIAEERSFLSDAGPLLASSLDYDATLASLAELAVPRIADWCSIQMVEPSGSVRTLAVAHVDPEKVQLALNMGEYVPFDPDAPMGAPYVLRTGQPELTPTITDEMLVEGSPNPLVLETLRALGLTSSMVVPLTARGRILGAITLVSAESGRTFGDRDLNLALDLASRAALAVDNAHLYQEAERSSKELRQVLQQMSDAVMIANADGVVTFANDAAHAMMGGITIGANAREARPNVEVRALDGSPVEPQSFPLSRAGKGEYISNFRWIIRSANRPDIVAQTNAVPLHDDEGNVVGAVTVSRDITAQHDFERYKDEFFLSVSHDLKNPLTLVKGVAQMLLRRVALGESENDLRITDGLERIDATVKRMSDMINNLLDVSRMEIGRPISLEPTPVDLVELVRSVAADQEVFATQHTLLFSTEVEHCVGQWDAGRLERVVANLLSNAVKFSPDGGDINIRVSQEEDADGTWAILSISDSGLGIPQADQEYIFQHFGRANNVAGRIAGTGLGLPGVKQIVEQHGGGITVVSRENDGSTFTIRLPLGVKKVEAGGDHV